MATLFFGGYPLLVGIFVSNSCLDVNFSLPEFLTFAL